MPSRQRSTPIQTIEINRISSDRRQIARNNPALGIIPQERARDGLAEPDFASRDSTSVLQGGDADMIAGLPTGKQPQAGMRSLPIGAQNVEQPRRQHRVAILRALAAFDVDQHALAVDRGRFQTANLSD